MGHGLAGGFIIHRIPEHVEYLIIDDGGSFEGSRLAEVLGSRAMVLSDGSLFVEWDDHTATLHKDTPTLETVERIKREQAEGKWSVK